MYNKQHTYRIGVIFMLVSIRLRQAALTLIGFSAITFAPSRPSGVLLLLLLRLVALSRPSSVLLLRLLRLVALSRPSAVVFLC